MQWKIEVARGGDYLARYAARMRAIGEYYARQAMAHALNRAGDTAYGRVRTTLSNHLGVKYRALRITNALRRKTAYEGRLEYKVIAIGSHFDMIHAKGVRTRKVVREVNGRVRSFQMVYASAWNVPRAYPGAFIGRGSQGLQIFTRANDDRFPLHRVWGPSIPVEILREPTVNVFEETIEDVLPKRLEHEVSRLFDSL
ncbi:MAG: phage tail protein [Pseudomonadota bacterium]